MQISRSFERKERVDDDAGFTAKASHDFTGRSRYRVDVEESSDFPTTAIHKPGQSDGKAFGSLVTH